MSDRRRNDKLKEVIESVDESRRDVLRKLAFGATLAAPVIASFVAPATAAAQGKGKGKGGKGKGKGKGPPDTIPPDWANKGKGKGP